MNVSPTSTVPQQEVSRLRAGGEVRVTSDGFEGTEVGRVTAIDSLVNQAMRNMQVQAVFENKSGRMRPGMFVETQLARGAKQTVLTVPASAIAFASGLSFSTTALCASICDCASPTVAPGFNRAIM